MHMLLCSYVTYEVCAQAFDRLTTSQTTTTSLARGKKFDFQFATGGTSEFLSKPTFQKVVWAYALSMDVDYDKGTWHCKHLSKYTEAPPPPSPHQHTHTHTHTKKHCQFIEAVTVTPSFADNTTRYFLQLFLYIIAFAAIFSAQSLCDAQSEAQI